MIAAEVIRRGGRAHGLDVPIVQDLQLQIERGVRPQCRRRLPHLHRPRGLPRLRIVRARIPSSSASHFDESRSASGIEQAAKQYLVQDIIPIPASISPQRRPSPPDGRGQSTRRVPPRPPGSDRRTGARPTIRSGRANSAQHLVGIQMDHPVRRRMVRLRSHGGEVGAGIGRRLARATGPSTGSSVP